MENERNDVEKTQSDEKIRMSGKKKNKESREMPPSRENVRKESSETTMASPDKVSRVSKEKTQDVVTDGGEEEKGVSSAMKMSSEKRSHKSGKKAGKSGKPSKEKTWNSPKNTQASRGENVKKSKENPSKETTATQQLSKETTKKSKKKEQPPKSSLTKSAKTNRHLRKLTKEKMLKEKEKSSGGEEDEQQEKSKRTPPVEFEEHQMVSRNHNPVKYSTEHYKDELKKMMANNMKNSLLCVSDHVIRFRQSSYMESCFHLDIHNPTGKHVLFRVERPKVPYLSVKPKIGFLAPGDSRTIYLLFSFRCPRLPDDLAFSYIIYQVPIKSSDLPPLEHDKKNYTTKKTRKIAKGALFEHRWTVGVAFYAGDGDTHICSVQHMEGNPPQLDKGKIFQEDYNPDEHDDNSENLPSACD